jgi:hypothetical protein
MLDLAALEIQDQLIFTRDITVSGDRARFFRQVRAGDFVPIRRGAYLNATTWATMDESARARARGHIALASSDQEMVLSHESAVAMWRLPWFGQLPNETHVITNSATGGRSNRRLIRHTVGIHTEPVIIDGQPVTPLVDTVVDICRSRPFHQAVVVADAGLRRGTHPVAGLPGVSLDRGVLLSRLGQIAFRQGTARARHAIEFADGDADRPGESLSRVNIALAKLPAPRIQVQIRGASGRTYFVDFWWPDFNLIGEFDGKAKYSDPEFLRGRTPAQALLDEKARENDLRAAGHGMTRWMWETAISMPRLRRHLVGAGLR